MPVHFNTDGKVTADTVDEAIRFEQLRGRPINHKKPVQQRRKKGPRLEGWAGFLDFLAGPENATARKILALVHGGSTGLDSRALAAQIEVDVQVVSGTITGIRKKASAVVLNRLCRKSRA